MLTTCFQGCHAIYTADMTLWQKSWVPQLIWNSSNMNEKHRGKNNNLWMVKSWGSRSKGGKRLGPGMALETRRRELAASGHVIFTVASCSSPPPPLPVWALSAVEFSPQNLAGSPQGLSLSHLSINYRFAHENRTDDSHYLLGWVRIFF